MIFDGMLATLGADSQIDIVYTQRHYFDWLVSMHGQEFDAEKLLLKPKYNNFEARAIPTIEEYLSGHVEEHALFLKALEFFRAAWLQTSALRVPLAVTWLTRHRQLHMFNHR